MRLCVQYVPVQSNVFLIETSLAYRMSRRCHHFTCFSFRAYRPFSRFRCHCCTNYERMTLLQKEVHFNYLQEKSFVPHKAYQRSYAFFKII